MGSQPKVSDFVTMAGRIPLLWGFCAIILLHVFFAEGSRNKKKNDDSNISITKQGSKVAKSKTVKKSKKKIEMRNKVNSRKNQKIKEKTKRKETKNEKKK